MPRRVCCCGWQSGGYTSSSGGTGSSTGGSTGGSGGAPAGLLLGESVTGGNKMEEVPSRRILHGQHQVGGGQEDLPGGGRARARDAQKQL